VLGGTAGGLLAALTWPALLVGLRWAALLPATALLAAAALVLRVPLALAQLAGGLLVLLGQAAADALAAFRRL
jgi:hypothetical protein